MRVLIVDDEPLVRRSLEKIFLRFKHEVQTASHGIEGRTQWKDFDPELVFLDVLMPGLSGPELLKEMRGQSRAKVVLMSAFTGDPQWGNSEVTSADLFLAKPFENILDVYQKAIGLLK